MTNLWDELVKKYPRYTIAILLVYALLVSAYTIYSSVRYYIELKKPYLKDLAEACGNISEIAARISQASCAVRGRQPGRQDGRLQNVLETITPSNYAERKLQLERPGYAISGAC